MDIDINSNGNNAAIKYNILCNSKMKKIGFKQYNHQWHLRKNIGDDMVFNMFVPEDGGDINIYVYDERYMCNHDYQLVLKLYPNKFSRNIKNRVDDIMEKLVDRGIVYGWKRGDYI